MLHEILLTLAFVGLLYTYVWPLGSQPIPEMESFDPHLYSAISYDIVHPVLDDRNR